MRTQDLITAQLEQAYKEFMRTGQVVKIVPQAGSVRAARTLAYNWRQRIGAKEDFEIRYIKDADHITLVPIKRAVYQPPVKPKVEFDPEPEPAKSVPNILVTSGRMTKEVLDAIHVLLASKIITACEFIDGTPEAFDRAASPEHKISLLTSKTKKGLVII